MLWAFVDAYNDEKPLREQLRANHLALMSELLNIYRIVVWRASPLAPLRGKGERTTVECMHSDRSKPLIYLSANNVQLGRRLRCDVRTVQNLRRRLRRAGLIVDEIWHGTEKSYELLLNPQVLCFKVANRYNAQPGQGKGRISKSEKGAQSGPFFCGRPENFSSYCNQLQLDTNKLNQLEALPCGEVAQNGQLSMQEQWRDPRTGYETDSEESTPLLQNDKSPSGENSPPRVARRPPEEQGMEVVPETFSAVVAHLPDKLGRRIFREVSQVWEVARTELYAGQWIADQERERAKARLAEYYIYAKPPKYRAGTTEICERIRLVRKWIERGRAASPVQERWVPIPSIYFDYRNGRGFSRTKAWFKKHKAKRVEIGDNIALAKAVWAYRASRHLEKEEGPMTVYRQLVERLAARNEALVGRFLEAVGGG